jgi:hypothetical protein
MGEQVVPAKAKGARAIVWKKLIMAAPLGWGD